MKRKLKAFLYLAVLSFFLTSALVQAANVKELVTSSAAHKGILGALDVFSFKLQGTESILITVSQVNADVKLALFDSQPVDPKLVFELSTPVHTWLNESIFITAQKCTECLLKILPYEEIDSPGQYSLSFERYSSKPHDQRLMSLFTEAGTAWLKSGVEQDKREQHLSHALNLYEEIAEDSAPNTRNNWQIISLYHVSFIHHLLGNYYAQEQALTSLIELIADDHSPILMRSKFDLVSIELARKNLDLAATKFEHVLQLAEQQNDDLMSAKTIARLGSLASDKGNNQQAVELFEQARVIFLSAGDWRGTIHATLTIGWIKVKQGQLDEALNEYHQALSFANKTNSLKFQVNAYTKLASVYRVMGDFDQANYFIDQALTHSHKFSHSMLDGWAKQEKGRILQNAGQFELAVDTYEEAQQAYKKLNSRSDEVNIDYFLSIVHSNLENYPAALAYAQKVLENDQQTGVKYDIGTGYSRLAEISLELGAYSQALKYQELAFESLEDVDNKLLAGNMFALSGELYFHNDNSEKGLAYFEKARSLQADNQDLVGAINTGFRYARSQEKYGEKVLAIQALEQAERMINQQQQHISRADLRRSYLALYQKVTSLHIRLLRKQGKSEQEMLAISELFRTQTLRERMLSMKGSLQVSQAHLTKRKALHTKLHAQIVDYHRLSDQTERELIARNTRKLANKLQQLETAMYQQQDQKNQLPAPPPIAAVSIEDIQQALPPDSLIMYFDTGELESHLWIISQHAVEYSPLPDERVLSDLVSQLLSQVRVRPAARKAGEKRLNQDLINRLSTALFKNVTIPWGNYKQILVVPDGPMHYLPLSMLSLPNQSLPFVDSTRLAYLPSLAVFQHLSANSKGMTDQGQILLVANPAMQNREQALSRNVSRRSSGFESSELPHTQKEANAIAALAGNRVQIMTRVNANKQQLMALPLNDFEILHFATHAIANDHAPSLGGLVLSNSQFDDNLLLAPEIANLKLKAELVVLSGCETAVGQHINGEGLMGLSRAFFEAGAKNVLASLWSVQDNATAALMESFYRYLLRDKLAPEEALRLAKLYVKNFRRKNGHTPWRDPHYWAGFVLQGASKFT